MVDQAKAAQLESSQSFSKAFLDRHGFPTARWKAFTNEEEACTFITSASFPALVVKASGLAAGKGVIVAANKEEACQTVHEIMRDKTFGETIVVEELLEGEEVSCLCFTDGITVVPMPPAQDLKWLMDGDQGPNKHWWNGCILPSTSVVSGSAFENQKFYYPETTCEPDPNFRGVPPCLLFYAWEPPLGFKVT